MRMTVLRVWWLADVVNAPAQVLRLQDRFLAGRLLLLKSMFRPVLKVGACRCLGFSSRRLDLGGAVWNASLIYLGFSCRAEPGRRVRAMLQPVVMPF